MPYAESWLKWEDVSGGRAALHGGPEELRAQFGQLMQALVPMMPPMPENVTVVEGEHEGIKYRTYTPKEGQGPFPIAIATHAGGYVLGDINSDELICRIVAVNTNSAVVNVDYRLAPEHVWPAQLEDSVKMYKWAVKNAASFGGDPTTVYTMGASAGGGLALQVTNQILRDPSLKSTIKGAVALVPITAHWDSVPEKYKADYKSIEENAEDVPVINKSSMVSFYEATKLDPNDASCFTILATDKHAEFPPVYFANCEYDPLRDDATIMIKALNEAGVPTKHDYWKGLPHCFWFVPPIPEGQEFVMKLLGGIEWIKSQM